MAKTPKCKGCGGEHYKINCRTTLRKAIKSKVQKTHTAKPKKKETRSQLVKKLDKVFSEYIRRKDAIEGISTCITCGDRKEWKLHQNGHYMSRGHYNTRWDETNCHVQCVACNMFRKGNYTEYALYMISRYGVDYLEELKRKAGSSNKISTVELRELTEVYKKKLQLLA